MAIVRPHLESVSEEVKTTPSVLCDVVDVLVASGVEGICGSYEQKPRLLFIIERGSLPERLLINRMTWFVARQIQRSVWIVVV